MKKILSLLLVISILCTACYAESASPSMPDFKGINDPALLPYIEGTLYQELVNKLNSEDYFVENISTVYISQEYLDELAYNSQANIFFGYTLAELDAQFQGTKYVFTLGENSQTIVEPFEVYNDTYERVLKNVAIGTGVILICVTVSVATAGAGAPAVSMIFAAAAKSGTVMALQGGLMGGVSAGIVTGIQTGNMEDALKAAAIAGSEGFKWGAISGAISGGVNEAIALKGATLHGLTMNQAATIQKESGYPIDIIKEFHSVEEYEVYKEAGLYTKMVGNKAALIREIDLDQVDSFGRTNLQRMEAGQAALDSKGIAYEIHHVGQKNDSVFAILTREEHRGAGNFTKVHAKLRGSDVDHGIVFDTAKKEIWKEIAKINQ